MPISYWGFLFYIAVVTAISAGIVQEMYDDPDPARQVTLKKFPAWCVSVMGWVVVFFFLLPVLLLSFVILARVDK